MWDQVSLTSRVQKKEKCVQLFSPFNFVMGSFKEHWLDLVHFFFYHILRNEWEFNRKPYKAFMYFVVMYEMNACKRMQVFFMRKNHFKRNLLYFKYSLHIMAIIIPTVITLNWDVHGGNWFRFVLEMASFWNCNSS